MRESAGRLRNEPHLYIYVLPHWISKFYPDISPKFSSTVLPVRNGTRVRPDTFMFGASNGTLIKATWNLFCSQSRGPYELGSWKKIGEDLIIYHERRPKRVILEQNKSVGPYILNPLLIKRYHKPDSKQYISMVITCLFNLDRNSSITLLLDIG